AEDGIRDKLVTGVQTCALPILGTSLMFAALVKLLVVPVYLYRRLVNYRVLGLMLLGGLPGVVAGGLYLRHLHSTGKDSPLYLARSEERRVGKEWRDRE